MADINITGGEFNFDGDMVAGDKHVHHYFPAMPSPGFASPFRLKIFISSTQDDLQAERDAVQTAIESLGYICWRAEKFHVPGWTPEEVCRHMARECDVYVGIFGKRYGTIDAEIGISITEMEFETAKNNEPTKMLVYIKEATEREERQVEFLTKIQDFHQGYFRHDFFSSTETLSQDVRNDLIAWVARQIIGRKDLERELQALKIKMEHVQTHMKQIAEVYGLKKELLL